MGGAFQLASLISVLYGMCMHRIARAIVPGIPHHVIWRGNRRVMTRPSPAPTIADLSPQDRGAEPERTAPY